MLKKLTKHGNSLALVIDRPILDLLKIDTETPLDISTDGNAPHRRSCCGPSRPEEEVRRRAGVGAQAVRQGFRETGQVKGPPELAWTHCSFLSMKCWRCTSSKLTDMADHPVSVIPEGCSRPLRLHRPPSVASIFTRPSRPWPPPTCFTFARTMPLSTATSEWVQTRRSRSF